MKQDREHQLQVACVRWFRSQYPRLIIYAIPNGGQRHIAVARKLKAEGVLAGVPDLHIPIARNGYNSLYIELKVGRNKPSSNQREMIKILSDYGHKCEVCYTIEEFIKTVKEYLNSERV